MNLGMNKNPLIRQIPIILFIFLFSLTLISFTKEDGSSVRDSANGINIDSSRNFYVAGVTYKNWMVIPVQTARTFWWLSTTPMEQSIGLSSSGHQVKIIITEGALF